MSPSNGHVRVVPPLASTRGTPRTRRCTPFPRFDAVHLGVVFGGVVLTVVGDGTLL